MKNVLVTLQLQEHSRIEIEQIEGYSFRFKRTKDVTDDDLAWAQVIVGGPSLKDVEKAPSLEWIQTPFAGVNTYKDLPEHIILSNAYGAYGQGIGEFMTACVLSADKKLGQYARIQKERQWECLGFGKGVSNMKVLSVGAGSIGRQFMMRMHALGAECRGVTRTKHDTPEYAEGMYTFDQLDELLPDMDVVALSLPETELTIHMFDRQRLEKTKPGSILINVGRGTAIVTHDLLQVVRKHHFSAVFLDVTDPEPLPKNDPLWTEEDVYITPHISGRYANPANYENVLSVIKENLRRSAEGKPLLHVVNKESGGY